MNIGVGLGRSQLVSYREMLSGGCNDSRTNAPDPPEMTGSDMMLTGFVALAARPMVRPISSIRCGTSAAKDGERRAGGEAECHHADLGGAGLGCRRRWKRLVVQPVHHPEMGRLLVSTTSFFQASRDGAGSVLEGLGGTGVVTRVVAIASR